MKYLLSCLLLICGSLSLQAQAFRLTATEKPQQHTFELDASGEINLTIDGFAYGEGYLIHIAGNRFERQFEFDNLPADTKLNHPDYLQGVAQAPAIDICIGEHLGKSGALQLIISKEDAPAGRAKMNTVVTQPSTNLDSLLDILFRNESCFEWNSLQLIGGFNTNNNFRRTGTFTNGQDFFDMEEGIILTTGFVSLAPGPNSVVPANGIFPNESTFDQDAIDLAGPDPRDIAIIEFEFVPTTDSLKFNYVFFSEEYCEFTQTTFGNDAFGFFLSGPGIPGGKQNIARLPNGDIVSTRTVNDIFFPELFVDNTFPSPFGQCMTGMPVPPERLAGVNYNGWTTKLTAKAEVIPCETYTIKLVVADGSGYNFNDSGVLLEAGSFIAGLIADPEPSVQGIAGNLTSVEGCDTATITFNRLFFDSLDLLNPLEVNYNLIGGAINPANAANDFELPPGPFIIPAGDTSGVLKIPITGDINDTEGLESFIVRYDGTCNCDVNRDTFYIQDAINLQVDLGNDTLQLCAGQPTIIEAATTGGNNQYTYVWPDGQDTSRITYVPDGRDTLIVVDVMDACGLRGQDSIQIIAPALAAATSGDFSLCTNTEVQIPIDVEGTDRYTVVLEIDSGAMVFQDTFVITQDTNIAFDFAATISILSVTDIAGCGGATSGQATIITGDIEVAETLIDPDCELPNGSITLAVDGGNNNFSYAWADDGSITAPNRTGLVAGSYTVTVTRNSDTSCPVEFNYTLNPPLPLVIDSIAYNRPSCPGESVELAPIVNGGTPPYSFIWPDSSVMDSILTIQSLNGTNTYAVIVEDACGVESTASVTITLPVFSIDLDGRYSLCNQDTVRVPFILSGPAGTYAVDVVVDSASTSTVSTLNLSPGTTELLFTRPASIRVEAIRNLGGCTGQIINNVATVIDPQLDLTATVTHPTCPNGIDGSISVVNTSNVPVTYTWSDGPSTDPNRTGLAAGAYTVSIRDAEDASCLFDSTFTLSDPPTLAVALISAQNLSCPYQLDTLVPVVNGGTPPFSFSWPDSMSVDSLLPIFVGGGASSYRVEVTDACMNQAFAVWDYNFEDVRASTAGAFGICNAPFNTDVPITVSGSASYQVTIRENG
ncbi:MAG: choice-of-anchor L domain-containing protein, partial [Bacteroidota bacterium]